MWLFPALTYQAGKFCNRIFLTLLYTILDIISSSRSPKSLTLFILSRINKNLAREVSQSKGSVHKVWLPKFGFLDSEGGKRELTLDSHKLSLDLHRWDVQVFSLNKWIGNTINVLNFKSSLRNSEHLEISSQ